MSIIDTFCERICGNHRRAEGYRQGWADASVSAAVRVRTFANASPDVLNDPWERLAVEIEQHGELQES